MPTPTLFDSKNFNPEVFGRYMETIPRVKRNALLKSGAIARNQTIAAMFAEQSGGNYATTPMFGRIDGTPDNYDGATDIGATKQKTYTQSRVVIGRAKSWTELDFAQDITGAAFIDRVGTQIADYWDDIDQDLLLSILKGVFSMTGAGNTDFVSTHTYDISSSTPGTFDATTLNTAMQKAAGDNKALFSLTIMHSNVATNLENLRLLEYLKQTDANGMTRDLALATLNGRTVLIDDSMPVETTTGADPVTKYTTYVLGAGAFELTDCDVKTPYEMSRDPKAKGGQDFLFSRRRLVFAPRGISFTKSSMTSNSPTTANLENGANWALVNSNESTKEFFPHKAIPIARIISKG